MKITLSRVGKKYNNDWIFKNVDAVCPSSGRTAIVGHNGSGKSTLLQLISGFQTPSEGTISIQDVSGNEVSPDELYSKLVIASPYLELIEEFTLNELVSFHTKLKPLMKGIAIPQFLSITGLEQAANKQILFFSSGMKQRLRLALAFLSDVEIILLDEPLTNLDENGKKWYAEMINRYSEGKTLIISSNYQSDEYPNTNNLIKITDFK